MQLKKNSYSNLNELKYAIQDIWNRIPLNICQNLMKTFDTRIKVVNKLNGGKYTSKIESEIVRKKLKRRKKLRKRDFEVKPTYDFTNYWNFYNDNILLLSQISCPNTLTPILLDLILQLLRLLLTCQCPAYLVQS